VFVLHPAVDRASLLRWITESDAVVNTSMSEGQSNVVLEAMALGTPVVVRGNEGNRSIVSHNRTGYVFGQDDAKAALRQLAHASSLPPPPGCDDEPLADPAEVSAAASTYAAEHHSVAAEASAWLGVIGRVLTTLPGGGASDAHG